MLQASRLTTVIMSGLALTASLPPAAAAATEPTGTVTVAPSSTGEYDPLSNLLGSSTTLFAREDTGATSIGQARNVGEGSVHSLTSLPLGGFASISGRTGLWTDSSRAVFLEDLDASTSTKIDDGSGQLLGQVGDGVVRADPMPDGSTRLSLLSPGAALPLGDLSGGESPLGHASSETGLDAAVDSPGTHGKTTELRHFTPSGPPTTIATFTNPTGEQPNVIAPGTSLHGWVLGTSLTVLRGADAPLVLPDPVAKGTRVATTDDALAYADPSRRNEVYVLRPGQSTLTDSGLAGQVVRFGGGFAVYDGTQVVALDPSTARPGAVLLQPARRSAGRTLIGFSGGRLVGSTSTSGSSVWTRSVQRAPSSVSDESVLVARSSDPGSTRLSGTRTLHDVLTDTTDQVVADDSTGATRVLSATERPIDVNGPYAQVGTRVVNLVTGYSQDGFSPDGALWGSSWTGSNGDGVLRTTSLLTGRSTVVRPACSCTLSGVRRSGSLILIHDDGEETGRILDLAAGTETSVAGHDVEIDNGLAAYGTDAVDPITKSRTTALHVLDLATKTVTDIADDARSWRLDDGRVAWTTPAGELKVADVPGYTPLPPALLGIGAPVAFNPTHGPWTPQLDTSAPLTSYVFTITDGKGAVVYSHQGAAPDTAVRDLSWTPSSTLADGDYTWSVAGTGAGGALSGAGAPLSGRVKIIHRDLAARLLAPANTATATAALGIPLSWSSLGGAAGPTTTYDVAYRRVTLTSRGETVGPLTAWKTRTTATHGTFTPVAQGQTYVWFVRAHDTDGSTSPYVSATVVVPLDDSSSLLRGGVTKTQGDFNLGHRSANYLGTVHVATGKGATLTLVATGRRFAVIGDRCPTCGAVQVFVGTKLVTTVDTRATTTRYRQVLWTGPLSSLASRTLTLKVVGTTTRPTVRIDAIGVQL